MKEQLRADDTLVVWRRDRLARSLKDLISWVAYLEEKEVGLLRLHEAIDISTPLRPRARAAISPAWGALADKVALEFSECSKEMEGELA